MTSGGRGFDGKGHDGYERHDFKGERERKGRI